MFGFETGVHLAFSDLLDEDNGLPAEFRFRNRVVGAETDWGKAEGVAGGIAVALGSRDVVNDVPFRLLDEGLLSVECGLYPNARPIAATPTVPVAQSCRNPITISSPFIA